MRLHSFASLVVLLLSSGIAIASPAVTSSSDVSADSASADSSSAVYAKAGGGSHSSGGLLEAVGAAGAVAAISMVFHNHSTRQRMNVPAHAPEISTSGALSGLILLAGGGLIIRKRQITPA